MQIVDSAESTARVVKKMIEEIMSHPARSGRDNNSECRPERSENAQVSERSRRTAIRGGSLSSEHRTFRFYVTDSTEKFKRLANRFLGRQVDNVEHVDLGG
jgi:glutamate racemase